MKLPHKMCPAFHLSRRDLRRIIDQGSENSGIMDSRSSELQRKLVVRTDSRASLRRFGAEIPQTFGTWIPNRPAASAAFRLPSDRDFLMTCSHVHETAIPVHSPSKPRHQAIVILGEAGFAKHAAAVALRVRPSVSLHELKDRLSIGYFKDRVLGGKCG